MTVTQDIGQLADVLCRRTTHAEPMEILIMLDGRDPPVGRLRVDREAASDAQTSQVVEFTGWLGLLCTLDQAIGSTNLRGAGG